MANDTETSRHPLEQIRDWFAESTDVTIPVTELYDQGPNRLGMSEVEFRQWVAEGVGNRWLRFTDLTGALRLDPDVELSQPLPGTPPKHYGGY